MNVPIDYSLFGRFYSAAMLASFAVVFLLEFGSLAIDAVTIALYVLAFRLTASSERLRGVDPRAESAITEFVSRKRVTALAACIMLLAVANTVLTGGARFVEGGAGAGNIGAGIVVASAALAIGVAMWLFALSSAVKRTNDAASLVSALETASA